MAFSLSVLAADLAGITADVPSTAVWTHIDESGNVDAPVTFTDVSFNPGQESQPADVGGLVYDMGQPTLVIGLARFTGDLPIENDLFEVTYLGGQTFTLAVRDVQRGVAWVTITLGSPETGTP